MAPNIWRRQDDHRARRAVDSKLQQLLLDLMEIQTLQEGTGDVPAFNLQVENCRGTQKHPLTEPCCRGTPRGEKVLLLVQTATCT